MTSVLLIWASQSIFASRLRRLRSRVSGLGSSPCVTTPAVRLSHHDLRTETRRERAPPAAIGLISRSAAVLAWLASVVGNTGWARRTAAGFPADGEGPVRAVQVATFRIDIAAVTNAQFVEFIAASGYRTEAESFRLELCVPHAGLRGHQAAHAAAAGYHAVVGAGERGVLGGAGRSRLRRGRPRRASGHSCLVERRAGVLRLGGHAVADRGRVGICRARRVWTSAATPGATS